MREASDGVEEALRRDACARVALAAWCNVPLERLPASKPFAFHANSETMAAWSRVARAVAEHEKTEAMAALLREVVGLLECDGGQARDLRNRILTVLDEREAGHG